MPIKFSRRFQKEFKKSPGKIRKNFGDRLDLFIHDKFLVQLNNHSLAGKWQGYRSINITGDWRAIFVEMKNDLTVFSAIGTHSQLYG